MRAYLLLVLVTWWMSITRPINGEENMNNPPTNCFPAIFGFGDSLTDTGNAVAAFPGRFIPPQEPPYGMSYFAYPSGRYSDGRLFIDFLAQAARLPFVSPYLNGLGSNYQYGVNFAVVGATALNTSFITPFHIGVQIDWFKKFKRNAQQSLSSGASITLPNPSTFEDALYVVAIGGNDIINAIGFGSNLTHSLINVRNILPSVVNRTIEAIQDLYMEGARRFFIQNIPPSGCNPATLTLFSNSFNDYDNIGCIRPINSLLQTYNYMLYNAIITLRMLHPNGVFIYGDYYGVAYSILERHFQYGFNVTVQNCCGVGGYYNFNVMVRCGQIGYLNHQIVKAKSCSNPPSYVFWDGIHFTEAMNRAVAQEFLNGRFIDPINPWLDVCQFDMNIVY